MMSYLVAGKSSFIINSLMLLCLLTIYILFFIALNKPMCLGVLFVTKAIHFVLRSFGSSSTSLVLVLHKD